ncbi:hypothetical protein B4U79_17255 [Dinothrombium tinctorium]|uniref:Sushi domain-containing protein n=1 Tax=Dinothrombium tinctorium TaxID=1965070 RepID=A0A3S4R4G8_9ACAR|nr:hypothetical protein B4U79_17575 [Dinothrombium tinctorium]RWS11476.1 hypothetical protein B4U79_17524 [Dinothrombium tinctorium]RWS11480.1 hypothetical protein B4U79_17522 [Dinothrombium tinctorium]RWS14997.1 hypothetical protein B4U79_17255 [Dinothrombium tinctorium]
MIFTTFLILFLSSAYLENVKGFCGIPGTSPYLEIDENSEVSVSENDEGATVIYACEDPDNILIGSKMRKCVSGHWTQQLPKCASKLNLKNFKSKIDENEMEIELENPTKIAALKFSKIANDTSITAISGDFVCENETNFYFHPICVTKHSITLQNLTITFKNRVNEDIAVNFYDVADTECTYPDIPAFATIQIDKSCSHYMNCTRYTYECQPGFDLRPKAAPGISCDTIGEQIPLCVPKVFCLKVEENPIFEYKYRLQWNETHIASGGFVQYKCREEDYSLYGDAVRECKRNGTWSKKEPLCELDANRNMTSLAKPSMSQEIFNLPVFILIISLVIITMIVVFILIVLIHKRNQRITQLERIGSLRSRNLYYEIPMQMNTSYKIGTTVDDEIEITGSQYVVSRESLMRMYESEVDAIYNRNRLSLPNNNNYERIDFANGTLPSVLITNDSSMPQISL